jgi:hypothetical protein
MAMGRLWEDFDDKDVDTSWVSLVSKPGNPGVFGAEVRNSPVSSDLALWLEASDSSDELDRVRPGSAGRHRGDRKGDGLKDRAKLAMAPDSAAGGSWGLKSGVRDAFMPRVQPFGGGETCFGAAVGGGREGPQEPAADGTEVASAVWRELPGAGCSRPDLMV